MENKNKELPKALTIEELKNRVGKPVFVIATTAEFKNKTAWYVVSKIDESKVDNENSGYIEFTDCKYINFEAIHFFRFFDTEVSETELKEILEVEEKAKKKTGYERVGKRETYYTISSLKEIIKLIDYKFLGSDAEKRFKTASYFNDENLAKNIARAERLKYQLRRYAALNGGIPSQADWGNSHVAKYEIIGEIDNFIHATKNFESRAIGAIYFKDIEACKKAIEIFKKELIWYFTEFQEQLY
jgi:hypothetical protein